MTSTVTISCQLDTTDSSMPLGFEAWIDNRKFFDSNHIQDTQQLSVEISDHDAEHELKFIMKNKTPEHTQIDDHGCIVSDVMFNVTNITFDEFLLAQVFVDQSTYTHNFNGTGEETQEKFWGAMGCNGTVSLKFTTPVYLWLLENY